MRSTLRSSTTLSVEAVRNASSCKHISVFSLNNCFLKELYYMFYNAKLQQFQISYLRFLTLWQPDATSLKPNLRSKSRTVQTVSTVMDDWTRSMQTGLKESMRRWSAAMANSAASMQSHVLITLPTWANLQIIILRKLHYLSSYGVEVVCNVNIIWYII